MPPSFISCPSHYQSDVSLIPVEGGEKRPSDSVLLHHESRLILGKRQLFEAAKLEPYVHSEIRLWSASIITC